jgi:haloacetate dehalogenase
MFEGFIDELVDLGDVRLRVRFGGEGPPLLLIHGYPRTSATWHRVAPELLTAGFTVVCPDLRGYGRSSKPIIRDDHRQQAKRAVADDLAELMTQLDLTCDHRCCADHRGVGAV